MSEVGYVTGGDYPDDLVSAAWVQALAAAFTVARGEEANKLRGRYVKWTDGRGLHPFSTEVGRVLALQELAPELGLAEFDPLELRQAARADAMRDFVHDVQDRGADAFINDPKALG